VDQVALNQALSKLAALKIYVPEGTTVGEKYVREFEEILDLFEKESGTDLSSFRVPLQELGPKVRS
jgi:hypothetical protein